MEWNQRFLLKQWQDGSVAFDRHTGNTHALDPAASAVFFELFRGNEDRSSLKATVLPFCPDASDLDAESQLDNVLENLKPLGLAKESLR